MNSTSSLQAPLVRDILTYLDLRMMEPDIEFLDTLMAAYIRTVPWESASRIVRRENTKDTEKCPRWSETFWQDAMQYGTGGTCFESNYALFSLVKALGYEGYFTINDMGQSVGVHTAIVINVGGQQRLVDAGFPIHASLPIDPDKTTQTITPFHTYTVRPLGNQRYDIERTQHPNPNCFTLIDKPIAEADYRAATTRDYGENGLFLNQVVINKVVNERLWRFNSDERPYHLQMFENGTRTDQPIDDHVAATISQHFGIDFQIIRTALMIVGVY